MIIKKKHKKIVSVKGLLPSNTPRRLSPWKEMLASPWGTAYWESWRGTKVLWHQAVKSQKQLQDACRIRRLLNQFPVPTSLVSQKNNLPILRFSHRQWPSLGKSICSSSKASSDFTRCSLTVCLYSRTGTVSKDYLAPLNITGPCPVEEITS